MQSEFQSRAQMLRRYTQSAWRIFVIGLLFTAAAVAADLIGPYVVGTVLDKELVQGIGVRDAPRFVRLLALYVASILASGGFHFLSTVFFERTANRIAMRMQEDVFARLQRYPVSYFDSLPAGTVVSRITTDTTDVKVLYQVVLAQLLSAAVYALGVYGTLFMMDTNLFLMALIPLPILALIIRDYRKKSSVYNRDFRKGLSELNASLNENLQGMEIIQAFDKEEDTYNEYDAISSDIYTQSMHMVKLESYSSYNMTDMLQYMSFVLILLYFGYESITGAGLVTIGSVYIFVDYMTKIFSQAQIAFQRLGQLERANSAADNVFHMLTRNTVVEGTRSEVSNIGSVRFEQVGFAYREGEPVLQDISFAVAPGETVAFVGHTGSGKTTIMNLLFRYYTPQRGAVYVGGMNIEEQSLRATRENMAIVLQDPLLFSGTLYDNIALHDESISKDAAAQALKDVGGEEFLSRLPHGPDTWLYERGNSLSAGERQLISFARALVCNPGILVLDEATANIDSETEHLIQRGMQRLTKGRTTLLIAHRLSTIRHADRIFVLDHGRIVQSGTHEELIRSKGSYYTMYRSQSSAQAEMIDERSRNEDNDTGV